LVGERQLHQNAVHLRVVVETLYHVEHLRLRRVGGHPDRLALYADLLAGLALHADIDLARRIVTDQHHREARGYSLPLQFLDLRRQLGAHLLANRFSVDDLSGQSPRPSFLE
jgi:hypothetical protein